VLLAPNQVGSAAGQRPDLCCLHPIQTGHPREVRSGLSAHSGCPPAMENAYADYEVESIIDVKVADRARERACCRGAGTEQVVLTIDWRLASDLIDR